MAFNDYLFAYEISFFSKLSFWWTLLWKNWIGLKKKINKQLYLEEMNTRDEGEAVLNRSDTISSIDLQILRLIGLQLSNNVICINWKPLR